MTAAAFTLPDLGEGVDKGTIVNVLVKPGDVIKQEQPVLEIELDKATVELPSSVAGRVVEVKVKAGDVVKKGQTLLSVDQDGGADEGDGEEPAKGDEEKPAKGGDEERPAKGDERPAKADEKKPAKGETAERPAKAGAGDKAPAKAEPQKLDRSPAKAAEEEGGTPAAGPKKGAPASAAEAPPPRSDAKKAPAPANGDGAAPIPASPAVRRMARHLGVDLTSLTGSGARGRITLDDLAKVARGAGAGGSSPGAPAVAGGPPAQPALPDFSAWGEVTREPLSGVRKLTANAMARAWSLVPAVTHHDLADITDLEAGRKAFKESNPDAKVTMTVVILKALVIALQKYPAFNSTLDLEKGELITKKYIHVGVAVDTDHGLLVPVVRDVDRKPVVQLAKELDDLAARARGKKIDPKEMKGGTFTVSNLGGIGGVGFSPIVNWPEVAILGVSRAREQYVPSASGPVARLLMPLSLSYDHRVIDGAAAARFTKLVADLLSSPMRLLFTL